MDLGPNNRVTCLFWRAAVLFVRAPHPPHTLLVKLERPEDRCPPLIHRVTFHGFHYPRSDTAQK